MSKQTKIWMTIATFLIAFGLIMFTTVMAMHDWDFMKLNTVKYETNAYEIRDDFSNISLNTETADILFMPSDDGRCRVVCYEVQNEKHSASVQDDTLSINVHDERKWYEYIGIIRIGTPKITIYLPKSEYASLFIKESIGDIDIPSDFTFQNIDISSSTGDVTSFASASELMKVKTSTGNIRVEHISFHTLDLSASTGKVTISDSTGEGDIKIHVATSETDITNVQCENLISSGSTGDISLKNVIAKAKFSIERSTGDVDFDGCDAAEMFIKTDTGDVTGSLLSEKIFITQTDIGTIDIPKTTTGGTCEINTNTGDIRVDIR